MKTRIVTVLFGSLLIGCTQAGVQGTSLFSSFGGVNEVTVLSPTSVKLGWGLDSKYQRYNIYVNEASTPTKDETFSNTTVSDLQPGTTYSFKVTGVQFDKTEVDLGVSLSGTTFTNFAGLSLGGVTLKSPTEVTLTWNMNSATTQYKIFAKKKNETWDLTKPAGLIDGTNQHTVAGLAAGENYCFYIQANYKDKTFEPAATTEAGINAIAPCVQMTSPMQNLPTVTVLSAVPGEFPRFWTANGDTNYVTTVYELDTNLAVASGKGNTIFRTYNKTTEGSKNYYALVSKDSQVARVPVTIAGDKIRTSVKVRALNSSGQRGPIFPGLMNGGHGKQNFGSKIVSGDFNCDGLTDVAVSMPSAVIVPSSNHFTDTGAVVVYYSYRSSGPCFDPNDPNQVVQCPIELKTDVTPSVTNAYPNPVLITYPATSDLMRLGSQMAVGNFNGDCFERDSSNAHGGGCSSLFATETNSARLKSIKSCDDLVLSVNNNSFYVLYGDPQNGLVTGSGASTAGENEFTCDTFSNSCRVVRMTAPSGFGVEGAFVTSVTAGDFNNDGYDEVAVASTITSSGNRSVLIYRGSPQGLYPYSNAGNHASVDSTNATLATGLTALGAQLKTDDFGYAVGTAYDSRRCVNGAPAGAVFRTTQPSIRKGYDFTKCDDLVIGAPGRSSSRGSIFSCKANQANATDKQKITSWTCQEHFPTNLTGTKAGYGSSIAGARNFNGYPVFNIKSNPTNTALEVPEVSGAVFVGAPNESVTSGSTTYQGAGAVYGYYITPLATDYNSGGIQGILGSSSLGHPVESTNEVPCDRLNSNKTTGALRHCNNQRLTMSPSETLAAFGANLGILPLMAGPDLDEESMKMLAVSAPYRNVAKPGSAGSTLVNAGSVYLYRPDVSTFGYEGATPILSPVRSAGTESNYSCTSNCTWYSGGASPYGAAVFYPISLTKEAYFGSGGIVGGSFNNDTEGDLMATAPGLDFPTPQNGGAFIFNSNSGFAPTENNPSKTLFASLGLEGGYHFEEAKVVGDVNGDGYDDIVTHLNANGTWSVAIFYGSPNGLIKSPVPSKTASGTQPLLISLSSDKTFGSQVFPAGDVNGDGYKDILVIGSSGAYLYYGSLSGIVSSQEPVVSPIGKGPLLFARTGIGTRDINFSTSWAATSNPSSSSYNNANLGVSVADFNGDGFDDLAIRYFSNIDPLSPTVADMNFGSSQYGRVIVVYGSSNGPQVNRATGRITVHDGTSLVDVSVEDPCTATTPSICKVQLMGPPTATATQGYGFSVASVRRTGTPFSASNDRLFVSDVNAVGVDGSNSGVVYIYEGSLTGLRTTVVQSLTPRPGQTSQYFGMMITPLGDVNGDQYEDVAISTGRTTNPYVYIFYGQVVGGKVAFFGASSLTATDYWATPVSDNVQHALASQPVPQALRPTSILASGDLFGWGVTGVGDFNNDGYKDVAINIPNGDSTLSGTIPGTGFVIVYFGGPKGLQVENMVINPYPSCYGGTAPKCEPMQTFLPDGAEYENTVITPNSVGDINGDGFKDFVIGGVGRDLKLPDNSSATSTGVLYILY